MWISQGGEVRCTVCKATAKVPNAPCDCREDLPELHKPPSRFDGALAAHISALDAVAELVQAGLDAAEAGGQAYFTGCATMLRLRKTQYEALREAAELGQTDDLLVAVKQLKEQLAGKHSDITGNMEAAIGSRRGAKPARGRKPVH